MTAIVRFIQRPGALPTWRYERRLILVIEALCLLAGILAAPPRATLVLLVGAPFALWQVELARAARSADARKRETSEALGLPSVDLTCQRDIERAAESRQLATIAAPAVALAASVADSGGHGLTVALVVGFVTSVVRVAMVELYGPWRRWYRSKVPLMLRWPAHAVLLARTTGPIRADSLVVLKSDGSVASARSS